MGLSASQARFLQLTARKSNVEYQVQQINFQRLQWANRLTAASEEYQEKSSNRKLVYGFNNGSGIQNIDVTYNNYKNYMNQQMEGLTTSQNRYFLMSSSGNKIVVSNSEEMQKMIESTKESVPRQVDTGEIDPETGESIMKTEYDEVPTLGSGDFMIVEDLDDVDNFQSAIKDGVYFFAQRQKDDETGKFKFVTESWETIGAGSITEEYDKSDDAAAEAEFKSTQDKIQCIDKKLELQLDRLESERSAIQTEIESVSKVIKDNVESTFKAFS